MARPLSRRLARAAAALVLTLGIGGTTVLVAGTASAADREDPALVAHRGFSAVAPENTMPAVRLGVRAKAQFVEIDVQRSRDGRLVLLHDADLRRTTDVETVFPERAGDAVDTFTWAELQKLDAGSWKSEEYAGTRIPTLQQALRALSGTGSRLLLELKDPARFPGIERQTARVLDDFGQIEPGTDDRTHVQSFDIASMERFDRLRPEAEIGLLFGVAPLELSTYRWAEWINPSYRTVTRDWVRRAHREGFSTAVYTVNAPADVRRMARFGVDAIITDDPDPAYLALR